MGDWVYVILAGIGLVAFCRIVYLLFHKSNVAAAPAAPQTQRSGTTPSNEETDIMVYYANDRHDSADREYRFKYKWVFDSNLQKQTWRAYIIRMPSLGSRDPSLHKTHRFTNGTGVYWVCWDSAVESLKDMQTISRVWADSLQEYITTGALFG